LVSQIASLTSRKEISVEDIKNCTNIIKEIRDELDVEDEKKLIDEEHL